MKNINKNEIRKCIYRTYDEFKEIVEEITNGLLTICYELHTVSITLTEKAFKSNERWEENILITLSKYFEVEVLGWHTNDDELTGVLIIFKEEK